MEILPVILPYYGTTSNVALSCVMLRDWLSNNGFPIRTDKREMGFENIDYYLSLSFPDKNEICGWAASNGDLLLLKWARKNGCEWNWATCDNAAGNGYLAILKWARKNGCECTDTPHGGQLECLRWARANGAPWDEFCCANAWGKTYSYAASVDRWKCLQWSSEND